MKQPLIVIAGPTAVGKTETGIKLAKKFNGEIISGDSMQVYRKMDIGTAKATKDEQNLVPHHLIDILSPEENFSAADFKEKAEKAINKISSKNKLPIIVGGTGLYIQSLLYNYSFSESKENMVYRKELEEILERNGKNYLYALLQEKDPESAEKIHFNNSRRIIRSLEIIHQTGAPVKAMEEQKLESKYDVLIIGLTMNRELLYQRINERVDLMLENGLLEEVENLIKDGAENYSSMKAIGYKELIPYIKGRISLEEAADNLKQNSRRFAKRQLTWFRNKMPVQWFDVTENREGKIKDIERYIAESLQKR
ncbi:tRNA dimethylallyltransferase [Alkalicoccus daliensis]|uniref:tRNA dimethylallyltransferase n=1 Tax=Alkalicoccus daliensis TaxID=745820 RepID=A0A1H0AA00_9BACI|nr:tRNA dimethylallyltransferase [Alkalicoccus daliensis]